MMNTQLMSVTERTREIGVLRAVGWSRWRVMHMILGESLLVSTAGGVLGILLGGLALAGISLLSPLLSGLLDQVRIEHLTNMTFIVLPLGLIGGAYPAWIASRLQPIEALRYEGGTRGSRLQRLPVGGMAVQSLWQRSARSLLTLAAIGITVGAIMALEGVIRGMSSAMVNITTGSGAEIMVRERDAASSSLSSIDERIASRIAVLPGVEHVSRLLMTAITLPENGGLFMLQGVVPGEYAMQRIQVVEGSPLNRNRQILLGRLMADSLNKGPGDTIELSGTRFKIIGIFESGISWEEMGGVVMLRDAQRIVGKPRFVTMVAVKVRSDSEAAPLVEQINLRSPTAQAALTGEFIERLPEVQYTGVIMNGISGLAILVGGLAVMNTMLMSVMERTREIGVLRAIGWRRRRVVALVLQESLILGVIGGAGGIVIAFGLASIMRQIPGVGQAIDPLWSWDIFARAALVALLLGAAGGMYPAYRATNLQPTEALSYE
jgi:ABC-type antimicrobial peptide transport system permease subunit